MMGVPSAGVVVYGERIMNMHKRIISRRVT